MLIATGLTISRAGATGLCAIVHDSYRTAAAAVGRLGNAGWTVLAPAASPQPEGVVALAGVYDPDFGDHIGDIRHHGTTAAPPRRAVTRRVGGAW